MAKDLAKKHCQKGTSAIQRFEWLTSAIAATVWGQNWLHRWPSSRPLLAWHWAWLKEWRGFFPDFDLVILHVVPLSAFGCGKSERVEVSIRSKILYYSDSTHCIPHTHWEFLENTQIWKLAETHPVKLPRSLPLLSNLLAALFCKRALLNFGQFQLPQILRIIFTHL